ncbi:LL-diaminopimelate aminotransferase [Marispirochaeta aestuarii]|uniref:LL-diaminopimelate aminotransferase n=1 Tax=Marispirochaeta aestuarii TaxID=1963862 RepID=A0A1Y1S0E7_9SPIO|nr:LL-diaminopimelate aminotransferase [Marispirochaeta aestuarii]ORC36635.1 LL-diaminopimelate aminotransferase [Marispirochaeta aestuarii]
MITVNEHYSKLQASYLFVTIARKIKDFQEQHPDVDLIKLGIGDVTKPLPSACIDAFKKGVEEMADEKSFRGYGPEQGYSFLREAIARNDFRDLGIEAEDIFISDGAKCDTGNFQELFSTNSRVAIPDPVYPVYVDTNVMAGRSGVWKDGRYEGLHYLEANSENAFIPAPLNEKVDLIYLCFPNNPTGQVASHDQLARWVEYARENKALILFDAAYETFIRDDSLPRSIYEIPGAREVAVEFRSFSKTAGFTGTRCAFTVVPRECRAYTSDGEAVNLQPMWNRRHSTKFNGVSYPVQRAAEAVYSPEGKKQVRELSDYYLGNAAIIRKNMEALGFTCIGGENSPYIWVDGRRDSWDFFDLLLSAGVVVTPGSGFGRCGEGYIRISAFNDREKVLAAMERIKSSLA